MSGFYFLFWIAFNYSFRLYFRIIKIFNPCQKRYGRTIYVSNHQGGFMDPLLIAALRKPVVYFMVRSDVFNRYTSPFFRRLHMLPIFRQRDGVDTKDKNAKIFEKTNEILARNRNILIFGEGFTSDRIQRRLHPLKKGPVRIGFSALEYCDWKEEIYLQGLGINYTDFNRRGSDVLISAGVRIKLNDYKAAYQENPGKTIAEVTKLLENDMRSLITDVHDPEWADIHEDIMMLTRKGMHPQCYDASISLDNRWDYSKKLANWINAQSLSDLNQLSPLLEQIKHYKLHLQELNINENDRFEYINQRNVLMINFLHLLALLPFSVLGLLHAGIPYIAVKKWVEKAFKRPVFWGATKMVLGVVVVFLVNLPVLWFLPQFLPYTYGINLLLSVLYFLCIGIFTQAFLKSCELIKKTIRISHIKSINIENINKMNNEILEEIQLKIPVA